MGDHSKVTYPLMGHAAYSFVKNTAMIVLPASGALYFGLAQIWGFPRPEDVVGTIALLNTFLGVLAGVASQSYKHSSSKYDGTISLVVDEQDRTLVHVQTDTDITAKNEALFKIE